MAIRTAQASSPFIALSPGTLVGHGVRNGALSVAHLFKRNTPTTGFQGIHVIRDATPADFMFLMEFNGGSVTGDNTFSGWGSTQTFTSTTDFMILGFTWDGSSTAGNWVWRWKVGAGAWGSEAETAGSTALGGNVTSSFSQLLFNNTSLGDDASIDWVCGGLIKSTLSQATFESLSLTDFSAWESVFTGASAGLWSGETLSTLTDLTGNGADEVSRSAGGLSLVSDPAGWSWGGSTDATVIAVPADATGAIAQVAVTASGDQTVLAVPMLATGDSPVQTVTAGSAVTGVPAVALGQMPLAGNEVSVDVVAVPAIGLGSVPLPGVSGSGGTDQVSPTADAIGAVVAPAVRADALVTAVPATGVLGAVTHTVSGELNTVVTAVPAMAVGFQPAPVVSDGVDDDSPIYDVVGIPTIPIVPEVD